MRHFFQVELHTWGLPQGFKSHVQFLLKDRGLHPTHNQQQWNSHLSSYHSSYLISKLWLEIPQWLLPLTYPGSPPTLPLLSQVSGQASEIRGSFISINKSVLASSYWFLSKWWPQCLVENTVISWPKIQVMCLQHKHKVYDIVLPLNVLWCSPVCCFFSLFPLYLFVCCWFGFLLKYLQTTRLVW